MTCCFDSIQNSKSLFPSLAGRKQQETTKKLIRIIPIIFLLGGVLAITLGSLTPFSQALRISAFITGASLIGLSFLTFIRQVKFQENPSSQITRLPQAAEEPEISIPLTRPTQEGLSRQKYSTTFSTVLINVIQSDLRWNPAFHLNELSEKIENHLSNSPFSSQIHVVFLNEEGHFLQGRDDGGMSRQYFESLFTGITCLLPGTDFPVSFQFNESCSLYYPVIFDEKDEGALNTCQKIGKLFMHLYQNHIIGNHFDPALFCAAFCLQSHELNTLFSDLSKQTLIKLCKAFLEGQPWENPYLSQICALLEKSVWNEEEIREATTILKDTYLALPAEFENQSPSEIAHDIEGIETLKEALLLEVLTEFSPKLRAIHAVAQGMKQGCGRNDQDATWDRFISDTDYQSFSRGLQGEVDRNSILQSIVYHGLNCEIRKKTNWLKSWLKDEATEQEIKLFLQFATGSTGLPQKAKIHICKQRNTISPTPISHTCGLILEFSPVKAGRSDTPNDHTQPEFIACLKAVMNDPSFSIR